jgi:hypothetical protein
MTANKELRNILTFFNNYLLSIPISYVLFYIYCNLKN